MSSLSKDSKILIVGGGTFGLSTAWHLVRNGYSKVTVIDRHPLPSQDSAGYDLNKIFRTEYSDSLYSKLGHEARAAWLEEEVLKGCYAETGYIFAVKGDNKKSLENWQAAVDNSIKQGVKFDKLEKPEDFVAKAPVLNGPLKGWRGVYNAKAGWTHALNAMKAVYADCLRLGIRFVTGPSGTMGNLIQGEDGEVLGVEAEDGTRHLADRVILACGGWMDSVIDTKGQCLAKAWCLVHIQLTEEEAAKWKGMPVINNRMLGYMFEPDAEGRQLKIAPHSVGYTHYVSPGKSFPRAKSSYPSDGIPTEAKEGIRELLRDTLPDLADRPFGYERMCWDADSKDAHFLITDHPEHRNMYIAGGASAHGFKFFPIIGNHIMQLLEGRLEPELKEAWQWRPWQQIKQDTSRPDLPNVDLRDVEGWNNERVARL